MTPGRAPRGVLFDLWGTLVPVGTSAARAAHLHEMGRLLGADPGRFEQDWADTLGPRVLGALGGLEETVRRVAERQGCTPSESAVRRATEVRLAYSRTAMDRCAPVLPSLDALREAGLKLAVVSDTTDETPRLWSGGPLAPRFEATVFSCQEGMCKPDPRMYRRALERLGLAVAEATYVGDGGSRELTGAEAVGLRAYQYRCPDQADQPEYRFDPDLNWTGPRLTDLHQLLAE